jgi:hypothetical protein
LPPPRGVHRLPAELLEQQEHQPVDSEHRPWALVAHNLSTCCVLAQLWINMLKLTSRDWNQL